MSPGRQGPGGPPEDRDYPWRMPRAEAAGGVSAREPARGRAGGGAEGEAELQPGERVGENLRFELLERLGTGGRGMVFRARDHQLHRTVALKFLILVDGPDQAQRVEQLIREARTNARLQHPHIVGLYDIDRWKSVRWKNALETGVPFLVMELLEGVSLRELLARGPLSLRQATALLIDVARGLSHAHAQGVIHRDLKPSNVFVLPDGHAKILDFGLARSLGQESHTGPLTEDDEVSLPGTPAYMSPEQWRRTPQDGRSDLWALGVLFHEMLLGAPPFSAADLRKLATPQPVRLSRPSLRLRKPDLPEAAERIVAKALRLKPQDRYASAEELLSELLQLKSQTEGLTPAPRELRDASRTEPERRSLTLLCCTLIPEAAPQTADDDEGEALRLFHQLCAEAIEPFDGTVATSVSGQLLAVFGYPVANEDDAFHAVRAALAIQRSMEATRPRLRVRVGVDTGPVVVQDQKGVPALQGEAPGLATWLSQRSVSHGVLMSDRTAQLVAGNFRTEKVEGLEASPDVPGRASVAWAVLGERGITSRFRLVQRQELTPMVGREEALSTLQRLWEEARAGRGQYVLLSGDPGLGKSRVAHELLQKIGASARTTVVQSWPQARHSPLYPLIDWEYRSLGLSKTAPPEEKLARLEQSLAWMGNLEKHVPLWAHLMSVPLSQRYPPLQLPPDEIKARLLETLAQALFASVQRNPMAMVLEDAHWLDTTTLELLSQVLPHLGTARILLVITFRPDFHPPWPEAPYRHRLNLSRLSEKQAAALVRQVDRTLPDETVEKLVQRADGVPLFLEQLARAVQEAGDKGLGDIPDTLHALLRSRLDRLRGSAQEAAQLAALIGREFSFALLERIWTQEEEKLEGALAALIEAGLLEVRGDPNEGRYAFRHALIQEAAQRSLLRKKRQQHHQRIAQALIDLRPDTVAAQPERIAHHLAEAGEVEQAINFYARAGQLAYQRSSPTDAISHFTKALELLHALPDTPQRQRREVQLCLELGPPLMAVKGYAHPDVERIYRRARELCRTVGEDAQLIPALQGLWAFSMVGGALPVARELAEQLAELASGQQDNLGVVVAQRALAATVLLQGEALECLEHVELGFALHQPSREKAYALKTGLSLGVALDAYAGWALWLLGRPDEARERELRAVVRARELGHSVTLAFVLSYLSAVLNSRGEYREALAAAEEGVALSETNRLALWHASSLIQRGWARAGLDSVPSRENESVPGGLKEMRQGLEQWMKTGARAGLTYIPITLSGLLLRAGQPSGVRELLDSAQQVVGRNGEHFYEPELYRLLGQLLQWERPEDRHAAETHFQRGLDIARRLSMRAWELRLAMSRFRLWAGTAREAEAKLGLAEVYGHFTQGLDTADLREARGLLSEA